MITKVILKNFKRIDSEEFELSDFDLLVGSNNSGKSTLLQAMAIWQYCVDQFKRTNRKGSTGIQIVLPDFTALPLPEFNLLWKDKTERKNVKKAEGGHRPEFILIEISVFWQSVEAEKLVEKYLTVQLRYASPLSIYAIPEGGFEAFKKLSAHDDFPQIIYIPPFSGLEPVEKWLDDGNVKQNVGKGQPGSVLRNLLYRVVDRLDENGHVLSPEKNPNWKEIENKINEWFGVKLNPPAYQKGQSTQISMTYTIGKKAFDIISAGSGFHQILTLMAFFYGYKGITTILFDEPDAHLHVNLQKQILSYFKQKKQIQFLIATHSEEFIRGVEVNSIVSILSGHPKRIQSTEEVVRAMSVVDNIEVIRTKQNPYILYVEGEDDERILTAWAENLSKIEVLKQFYVYKMGGTSKEEMKKRQEEHFRALKQINPDIKRLVLFDYDTDESFHPDENNPVMKEWKRKNIENYLLVPEAWKKAILDVNNQKEFNLFNLGYKTIIEDFFVEQNLTLPPKSTWSTVRANIFSVVDGKKILFEESDSLFQRIKKVENLKVNREKVASNMSKDMIHEDVIHFFNLLTDIVS